MYDVNRIRKEFPILGRDVHPGKRLVYLDNAATTQKPRQVIDAITDFYENHNANIHRGVHKLSEESSQMYDDAHENVARFIGAESMEETVFVRNTTEGINLVMHSLSYDGLKRGDEIVTSVMEHHSNIVPWAILRARGVKVSFVDVNDDGTLKMEQYQDLVNDRTKLVTVMHGSNVLGTINDVKEIGRIAHENDALFMVDGAQTVPHMPVDVKRIGCDFMVFSGHKMAGPTGIGVLYGKKEILEGMQPFMFGGDMIREVHVDSQSWNDLPWRFEAGTSNVEGGVGLSAAIDYLRRLGMEDIRDHEKVLMKYALSRFRDTDKVTVYGPEDLDKRGGVISFNINRIHPHDVASILDSEGIAIRSGHHCAQPLMERYRLGSTSRASFYLYNTKEEIDRLMEGIEKAKKTFRVVDIKR